MLCQPDGSVPREAGSSAGRGTRCGLCTQERRCRSDVCSHSSALPMSRCAGSRGACGVGWVRSGFLTLGQASQGAFWMWTSHSSLGRQDNWNKRFSVTRFPLLRFEREPQKGGPPHTVPTKYNRSILSLGLQDPGLHGGTHLQFARSALSGRKGKSRLQSSQRRGGASLSQAALLPLTCGTGIPGSVCRGVW